MAHVDPERAKALLYRCLGDVIHQALFDRSVSDIFLNPDGRLWIKKLGKPKACVGCIETLQAQSIIETAAGFCGFEIHSQQPTLECTLPSGARFAGQLPPIVPAPTFSIRCPAHTLWSLEDYVRQGILLPYQKSVLISAIRAQQNILVVGGTGSGKTTLCNALVHEMTVQAPHERLCILEDTPEIQCEAEDFIRYVSTDGVSLSDLLIIVLRMRPDRIIVGEVRGPEAFDLIQAWNTGHKGGVSTIHANNANLGIQKLGTLAGVKYPPAQIGLMAAEAVDMLIHIERTSQSRKISAIMKVEGYIDGQYITKEL